jgi:autotransporter-associated beta strand protein
VFRFSSWLRKKYPDSFGISKRSARKKKEQTLRLERLEDRLTPSITLNNSYAGLNVNSNPTFITPPDPSGAAGNSTLTDDYVQTVNQSIGLFSQSTGASLATDTLSDFWYNQGGLPTNFSSGANTQANPLLLHPMVIWDDQISRFIVGDQTIDQSSAGAIGPVSGYYIAVSNSSNPADLTSASWNFFAIDVTESIANGGLADFFPDLSSTTSGGGRNSSGVGNVGYNADALVFTLNEFNITTLTFDHVQVVSVDSTSLTSAGPLTVNHFDLGSGVANLRPTVMHNAAAGAPMWLVGDNGDGQMIDVFRMDNPDTPGATFTEFQLQVNPFTEIGQGTNFPFGYPSQPDGSYITSNIDSRIIKAAEMTGVNGPNGVSDYLVASQAVTTTSGDRGLARWYEIDVSNLTNPTIADQANYSDPNSGAGQFGAYDAYPAIDINSSGAIGMTYSQSGLDTSSDFMSAYITGRDPTDSLGSMEPAVVSQAGGANNFDGREGNLSGINVDPATGNFWATAEYTDNLSNWNAAISGFSVAPSPANSTFVDLTSGTLSVTDNLANVTNTLIMSEVTVAGLQYVRFFDAGNTLTATGGAIQIDNNTVDALLSSVTTINVGPLDGNDSLTIDYSGGTLGGSGVTINYDGGATGTNKLRLHGGSFNNVIYTYNNDSVSGSIDLDGQFVNFKNTSSIADTNANSNETFNLPAGDQASLADDGSQFNTINTISGSNSTTTTFSNPGSSLTVATNGGGSLVQLASMDFFFAPGVETFSGLPGDIFQLTASSAIAFSTTVDLTGATLDLNFNSPTIDALNGDGTITDNGGGFDTLTVGSNGGIGTFSGTIQDGAGQVALAVNGIGAMETLSGTNTYTGLTNIASGTLQVGKTNALSASSDVTDNGLLDLNAFDTSIGALNGGGTVNSSAPGTETLTVCANGNAGTFSGIIQDASGHVSLAVSGANSTATETLNGTANTYSGQTIVMSGGTLLVGQTNALSPNSDVTDNGFIDLSGFSATIGALGGNGIVTNSGTGTFILTVCATGNSANFSGVISDGNATAITGLTVAGNGGTETLSGTSNAFGGPTTIDANGTLQVGAAFALSNNSDLTDNGTLDLNGFNAIIGALSGSGTVTSSVSASITLTVGATGHSGNFSGTIQDGIGTVGLIVNGTGAVETLSGSNTYSGITTIQVGTLQVGANGALSSHSDVVDSDTLDLNGLSATIGSLGGSGSVTSSVNASATLTVCATGDSATFSGSITDGSGIVGLTVDGLFAVETLSGTNTYSGATTITRGTLQVGSAGALSSSSDVTDNSTLDLNGFSPTIGSLGGNGLVTTSVSGFVTLTVGATGHSATFSGTIADGSGNMSLIVDGTGAVETLSGSNTYTGTTTISLGTLQVGANNALSSSSDVVDNATLDLNGFSATIGSLTGSGTVTDSTGSGTLTVGATGTSGTFTGNIQDGSGTVGLTVDGTGVVETLSGNDTYSGATTITLGTLQAGATTGLSSNSDVTVNDTLDLNGFSATIGSLGGSGSVTSSVAGLVTITVGADGHSATFSGVISDGSGTVGLTVDGTAVETLSGVNTYTGLTTITTGTLQFGVADAILTTSMVTDDGTIDLNGFSPTIDALNGSGTVTTSVSGSATLTVGSNGGTGSFSGVIKDGSGTVGLTVDGTGALETLSGANTYSGATTITLGTLQVGANGALSSHSDVTDTAVLDLNGLSATIGSLTGSGSVTSNAVGSDTLTVGADGHSATFSGVISNGSGTVGLTVDGTGAVETLSGANTYSGPTAVTAGTLQFGVGDAILTTSTVTDDGTIDLNGFSPTIDALNGSGTVTTSVSGSATLTVGSNGGTGSFSGVIQNGSGTVGLTVDGTGALETLSGADTYSGPTTITLGTLKAGADDTLPSTSDIIDNGTLDLNGHNDIIGALTGTGTVTSSVASLGGPEILTIGANGGSSSFSGLISNGGGTLAVTKTGGGDETIASANTYTGPTVVSDGTLTVNGTIDSNVTISGTGTLDGSGTITGTVTATGGVLAPGKLTNDGLTLDAGSAFDGTISGNTPGLYSQDTVASGSVSIDTTGAGVALNVTASGYTPVANDVYTIINNLGGTPISGNFVAGAGIDLAAGTPLTEGTILSSNFLGSGLYATITYQAGANHDNVGIIVQKDLTLTISAPSKSITNTAGGAVTYTIIYIDVDHDFIASTLNATNVHLIATGSASGTLSFDSGSGQTRTITVTPTGNGNGTLAISIDAGSAIDAGGNQPAAVGPSTAFTLDNTPPTITIGAPSKSITNTAGGPVTFTVTYADDNALQSTSLTASDITLNTTGGVSGSVSVSGTGPVYTVSIGSLTGSDGTLGFTIAAGTATDTAGNTAGAQTSGTFIVDNTAPTITIGAPSKSITNTAGGPVTFMVTYTDDNAIQSSSLTSSDITLINTGGTAGGTVMVTPGLNNTYTVSIGSLTGNGPLSFTIAAGTATDTAGNTAGSQTSSSFTVDNTPPTITIAAPSKSITNTAGGPVTFMVTYADDNALQSTSLTASDITLNSTGGVSGSVSVSGTGPVYTVSIGSLTGSNGTLGFTIAAGTATDTAGNTAGSQTSGTFIVDNTAPTITIAAPSKSITNTAGGPVTFMVTYADDNALQSTSLTAANITLINTGGTAGGSVTVSGTGPVYTVSIGSLTGNGPLSFTVAAGTATDTAGNTAGAQTSGTFIVDNTPPTITIGAPSKSITNTAGGPVTFTVTYTDDNAIQSTSLTASDITLINTGGDASGAVTVSGTGPVYTVSIGSLTGNGPLSFTIAAGTAQDTAGNTAGSQTSTTFTVDNVQPTITIGTPSKSITNAAGGPVTFTVSYSDPDLQSTSLTTADITLNNTGGDATGTVTVTPGLNNTYTVSIGSLTGNGPLGFTIAAGTAQDQAGNTAPAATSQNFMVDNTAVGISIDAPSKTITNTAGGPVTYKVTFTDSDFFTSTLSASDVHLVTTGGATANLSFDTSNGTIRTITVTPTGTGNGTLGISIDAGSASDQAGNTAPAATSATFTLDNTPVDISISNPSTNLTNGTGGPVTYTVTYIDTDFASSTLSATNVHLVTTGSATGSLSFDSGSGATRTVTISNLSGNGTIAISIDAGSASDDAGNMAPASGISAAFSVDTALPTSTVTALPAFSPGTFTVSWSGSDNGGVDQIASYTVFVSDNGSAFTPLPGLSNTTQTSTTFTGVNGHTYGFYTVAKDQAGNVQTTPSAAQATTRVDTVAPTSSVNVLPYLSLPAFTVSWTGTDDVGGSGIKYFDLYESDNGAAFTRILSQTPAKSTLISGTTPGHTYAFYTIATDNVGNAEVKTTADTQTEVPTYQTTLTVAENATAPPSLKIGGTTGTTLLSGHYTDSHLGKKAGIAVVSVDGTGSWQYSANGLTWTTISGVSTTSSLLLPGTDKLRFLPAPNANGSDLADLLFIGWDGSFGSAGTRTDTTVRGGGKPFSVAGGQVLVNIAQAAHAPAWTATSITLPPVLPGGANTGQTVQNAFGGVFANPTPLPANIAVTATTGTTNGTWMYQLASGGVPLPFPKIPAGQVFLLKSGDTFFFQPKNPATFTGKVSLIVRAWDGTGGGSDGTVVRLNKTDFGTSLLTANLYFNIAPVQSSNAVALTAINENTASKPVTVKSLVTSAGGSDADRQAVGIAITSVSGPGILQYKLSTVWLNVPATVSTLSALLLPSTAQLRFMPTADLTGTATFSWVAWDGTQGTAGQLFNASNGGGASAFSTVPDSATLTINAVHPSPAPAWSGTGAVLTPVTAGTTPTANTVAQVFGSFFEDPNATQMGIAISGVTVPKNSGTWKYSTDGGTTFHTFPTVSAKAALLLVGSDLIEFVPNAGFLGTASLTAHAWDGGGTGNNAGGTANLTLRGSTGGTSHFSATTLTATVLVNTAPTLH